MRYLINFIPGKNISTKSINDLVVTAHFEVPLNFNFKQFVDKPFELIFKSMVDGNEFILDCSLSSEGSSYYYSGTHKNYCIKIDIQVTNPLMIGYIVSIEYEKYIQLPTKTEM